MIPLAWLGQRQFGLTGLYAGIALANFCALGLAASLWKLLQAKSKR